MDTQRPNFNMMEAMNQRKIRNYREQNVRARKGQTVFAGSSLMENFPVNEMLMTRGIRTVVYNRGIGGYTIEQYDKALDVCVLDLQPKRLFINIGSNDLNLPGDTLGNLERGYRALLLRIKQALPDCAITLLAYYPCLPADPDMPMQPGRVPRTMENVNAANRIVKSLAEELGCAYLDLNAPLLDEAGYLRKDLSTDPIHFSSAGYELVLDQLEPLL